MASPTSVLELASLFTLSETAQGLLSVAGALVSLAVLVKGVCFIMEMVRGEGNGICPRGSLGAPDDPETRPAGKGEGKRREREVGESGTGAGKGKNGGIC